MSAVIKSNDIMDMETYKMTLFPFRSLMLKKCATAMQADWTVACVLMNELKMIDNMINGEERDLITLDYIICCEVGSDGIKRYWYEL